MPGAWRALEGGGGEGKGWFTRRREGVMADSQMGGAAAQLRWQRISIPKLPRPPQLTWTCYTCFERRLIHTKRCSCADDLENIKRTTARTVFRSERRSGKALREE